MRTTRSISISEAMAQYHLEFKYRTKDYVHHLESALLQFLQANKISTDKPVVLLTKQHLINYRTQLIQGTAPRSEKVKKRKPSGASTNQNKIRSICHFLKWLCAQDFLSHDMTAGIGLPARSVQQARIQREGFSLEDLSKIIWEVSAYRSSDDPQRVQWAWLTLGLIFSGARCQELLQLYPADVLQQDGVWCFRITDAGVGQHIKNTVSARLIPVHSQLTKAGLLQWIEKNSKPGEFIFPQAHQSGVTQMSDWTSKLLIRLGMKTRTKSQHSFRTTMALRLEKARTHYTLQRRLLGHSVGQDVESRAYLGTLSYSAVELKEALEMVALPEIPET